MSTLVHLAAPDVRITPPAAILDGDPAAVDAVAGALREALRNPGFGLVKLGALRAEAEPSFAAARSIVERVCELQVDDGGPADLRVEVDELDDTMVAGGGFARNRLPHNDGQRTTYLTPSILHAPGFDPALRTFSRGVQGTHKAYAGIFIQDPGDCLSVTTFFDALAIAAEAYVFRHGRMHASVDELAAWIGDNVRAAVRRQPEHGLPYISIGGLLSAENEPAWEAVSYCTTACSIPSSSLKRFARLDADRGSCPCGRCAGEAERLFCHQLTRALGRSWPEVRREHETWLSSERFDLLLWDNVTLLHGGVAGTRNRLLRPLFLTVDAPAGAAYERWLAQAWGTRLGAGATAAPASAELAHAL
jgi:hypothetical protein